MTSSIIGTAPATGLGQIAPQPASAGELPEATLLCCALAGWGNPLSGLAIQSEYIATVVEKVFFDHSADDIVRWRELPTLTPSECVTRWRWARRLVRHYYPHAVGVTALAASADEAGLPSPHVSP